MIYLRCASLITPARQVRDGVILMEAGKIVYCGPAPGAAVPPGAQVIPAEGMTAVPGFIDWQVNGGFGHDFTENPESIWEVGARLPEHGVTAFLPTIITAPLERYTAAIRILKAGPPAGYRGAQPLGMHFEGPFLNPAKKGAHNPAFLRQASLDDIRHWSRRAGVLVVTLAPELPGALEAVRTLRSRGVIVSAGHSLATFEQALSAFESGIRAGTHLFNAMPPLDHRAPGLAAALLDTQSVFTGLIPDGIHVHPGMVALAWKTKGPKRMTIVTDAMAALGMPPGEYSLGGYRVIVDETSARLEDGTLAGSILRMDQAVRSLLRFTGCSLGEATAAASLNPARLLRIPGKGRLHPGAAADLVLLDGQGQVKCTFVDGQPVYQNQPLAD